MNSGTISTLNRITSVGMRLRPSSDICEALRAEAFEGLKALPRRGLEVGGVLTQRIEAGLRSVIDGFERIPSQHLYGPSYRLSPLDLENFRARCREIQAGNAVDLVCFFRSSTRQAFQVTPEDVALASELSDTAGIVLIQPFLTGNAIFRVFQPGNDREWREFEEFEVSNDSIAPAPVMAPAAVPAIAEDPSLQELPPVDAAMGQSAGIPPPRQGAASNRTIFFWALGVVALVAAFLFVERGLWLGAPQTAPSASAVNGPDLGMQVVSQGDSLRLTWNRNLPGVRDSRGGNLQIHDGQQFREVALDSAQVAQAVIYYTPISDDVTFRLNIQGPETAQISGIARILASRKALPVSNAPADRSAPVPEPRNAANEVAQHRVKTSSSPEPVRAQPQAPPAGAEMRVPVVNAPNPPAAPMVPSAKPNVTSNATPNAEAIDLKKSVETAPAAAVPEVRGSSPLPVQSPPAASSGPAVPVLPPADSPAPQPAARTTESVPPRSPVKGDTPSSGSAATVPTELPVPPQPVKRIMPVRHSSAEPAVLSPMTVTVQVTIDAQGKVVEAHALQNPSAYWAGKAVEAAKQWRFEPASLHGQKVPSVSTIDFRFNP